MLSGKLSRKLWPKFAGIRLLLLASLDGEDRDEASEHRIIAPQELATSVSTDQRDNFSCQSSGLT